MCNMYCGIMDVFTVKRLSLKELYPHYIMAAERNVLLLSAAALYDEVVQALNNTQHSAVCHR